VISARKWHGDNITISGAYTAIDVRPSGNNSTVHLTDLRIFGNVVGFFCREETHSNFDSLAADGTIFFNMKEDIHAEGPQCSNATQLFWGWSFQRVCMVTGTVITVSVFTIGLIPFTQKFPRSCHELRRFTLLVCSLAISGWVFAIVVVILILHLGLTLGGVAMRSAWELIATFALHAVAAIILVGVGPRVTHAKISTYLDDIRKRADEQHQLQISKLFERIEYSLWIRDTHACKIAAADLQIALRWTKAETDRQIERLICVNSERAGVNVPYVCSDEFLQLARSRTCVDDPTFLQMKEPFWLQSDPIGGHVMCPRDGKLGCAFVDTLSPQHRGECTHFVSWVWGYKLSIVTDSLREWTRRANLDPAKTFLYMCFFVNNQFRILVDACGAGSQNLSGLFESNLRNYFVQAMNM
jgi:hypothetical protein